MATDSIKLYTAIYVALIALAASKVALFQFEHVIGYWGAVAGTLALAVMKTGLIVGYYQHLRWENRSLTWLMGLSGALVLMLMAAASYSVT